MRRPTEQKCLNSFVSNFSANLRLISPWINSHPHGRESPSIAKYIQDVAILSQLYIAHSLITKRLHKMIVLNPHKLKRQQLYCKKKKSL